MKKVLLILLIIALLATVAVGGYFILQINENLEKQNKEIELLKSEINEMKDSESEVDTEQDIEEIPSDNGITQSQLEEIVQKELYIVANRNVDRNTIKSISDFENSDLLTVAFNIYEENANNVTISQSELEEILKNTCFSNMTVKFENFDEYTFENGTYTKNENLMSKRNLYYGEIAAYKTVGFTQKDNQYILSVKNIFRDNSDSGDKGQYGYGSIDDLKNNENSVVQIFNIDSNGVITDIGDVQVFLDENFEEIKDKMATYNYVFEKQNEKIVLVDFYVD